MAAYKLTVRRRGVTRRERFDSLPEALAALEARLDELAPGERRGPERGLRRARSSRLRRSRCAARWQGPGAHGGDRRARRRVSRGVHRALAARARRARGPARRAHDALRRALGA